MAKDPDHHVALGHFESLVVLPLFPLLSDMVDEVELPVSPPVLVSPLT